MRTSVFLLSLSLAALAARGQIYPGSLEDPVILASAKSAAEPNTLLDGLAAYWKLEEATAANRVDSVNGLALVPSGTVSQYTGKVGYCAHTSVNAGGSLRIADNDTLSMGPEVSFEITLWAFSSVFTTTGPTLLAKATTGTSGAATNHEYVVNFTSGGIPKFTVSNGGTYATVQWGTAISTNDVWHFFDVYHDAVNNEIGISIDGQATFVSTSYTGGSMDDSGPFWLLRNPNLSSSWFNGNVDEVAIWKGRTLTSAERAQVYKGGAGTTYPDFAAMDWMPGGVPALTDVAARLWADSERKPQ